MGDIILLEIEGEKSALNLEKGSPRGIFKTRGSRLHFVADGGGGGQVQMRPDKRRKSRRQDRLEVRDHVVE